MKREKWYVINKVASGGVSADSSIEGIRHRGNQLYPCSIVPGDYFRDVTSQYEALIFSAPPAGHQVALPYEPEQDEFALLYTVYPATIPDTEISPITEGKPIRPRWYRVSNTHFVPTGLQALVTVEGVCQRGDVANRGDIVPMQWFAGLSMAQLERLTQTGVTSLKQWNSYGSNKHKIRVVPLLETYAPDPLELESLYAQYPGAHPDYTPPKKRKASTTHVDVDTENLNVIIGDDEIVISSKDSTNIDED